LADDEQELDELVMLVIDVCGEWALGAALARALEDLPYCPLDPSLRHLVPESSRARAVSVDPVVLRERLADQLRRLVRPH
jgi:hypothetical protein